MAKRCLIYLLLALLIPCHTLADSALKQELANARTKAATLTEQLKSIELKRANALSALAKTSSKLIKNNRDQRALLQKISNTKTALHKQRTALANQLQASYALTRQPAIKLLLSDTNPGDINRQLTYYKYLTKAQLNTITALKTTTALLQKQETGLKIIETKLTALKQRQSAAIKQISQLKAQRTLLLSQTQSFITDREAALNQALSGMHQQIASQGFAKLKGHLPWPVNGRVNALELNGVLMTAREDSAVHAVASGTVIFANWLAGYGLLVIIDHGDGYMTLYGRNNTITTHLGDSIMPGQTIATVGNSGGYLKPALYFAIRHNADPLNPKQWCG